MTKPFTRSTLPADTAFKHDSEAIFRDGLLVAFIPVAHEGCRDMASLLANIFAEFLNTKYENL
jgi:hypothetical protein